MTISGYKIHNAKRNHWFLLLREWIQCFERFRSYAQAMREHRVPIQPRRRRELDASAELALPHRPAR